MRWATLLLIVLHAVDAKAQGHSAGQPFVIVRAGVNLVGNTYRVQETRAVPGVGASVGTFLSPRWAVELEGWVRSSNPDCCADGREMLVSLSFVRLYAREGLQPYALGGITMLHAHSNEMQVQVGVGVQAPVYRRLAVAVDLRGNGGGSTMIVRPAIAAIYYFR
ncbi:MAG: hypothetical protein ND807_07470 [Vicinamibacterales bacterium]|nr:hypothetical protein [Vicinamibacterales bacterium]